MTKEGSSGWTSSRSSGAIRASLECFFPTSRCYRSIRPITAQVETAIVCRFVNRKMFRLRHFQKIGEFGGDAPKPLKQIINQPMTK